VPALWRFQGRVLESRTGSQAYDFDARSYLPDLGTFASLDSVTGGVSNPLSLNRYLYAAANPVTLVDPDGHCFGICIDLNPLSIVSNAVNTAASAASAVVNTATSVASNVVSTAASAASSAVNVVASMDASTLAHMSLGFASMVPGFGAAAAVLDAGLYTAEGDYMSAALSMASALPGGALLARGSQFIRAAGEAEKAASLASKVANVTERTGEFVSKATNLAEKTVNSVTDVGRGITSAADKALSGAKNRFLGRAESALDSGRQTASRLLAKNIEAATGVARRSGEAAHHIVPYRSKYGAEARDILDEFGIGINSAENGVLLDKAYHATVHTKAYYRDLTDGLRSATSRPEAIDVLGDFRTKLQNGMRWK
jgi:RHS repeat-associated protein